MNGMMTYLRAPNSQTSCETGEYLENERDKNPERHEFHMAFYLDHPNVFSKSLVATISWDDRFLSF
jgi:hypothetical protein